MTVHNVIAAAVVFTTGIAVAVREIREAHDEERSHSYIAGGLARNIIGMGYVIWVIMR